VSEHRKKNELNPAQVKESCGNFPGRQKLTTLTNSAIAELLALEAVEVSHLVQNALRRASRRAFLWPEEAAQTGSGETILTELSGVGPYIEN
jgi:hypothetical protein